MREELVFKIKATNKILKFKNFLLKQNDEGSQKIILQQMLELLTLEPDRSGIDLINSIRTTQYTTDPKNSNHITNSILWSTIQSYYHYKPLMDAIDLYI
jgi:TPP-dependent 2-oxoacid decarboxylase